MNNKIPPPVSISGTDDMAEQQQKNSRSNIQRQSAITVTPQSIIRTKPVTAGYQRPSPAKSGVLTGVKRQAQNTLSSQGDSGSSALSAALSVGNAAVKTVRFAQKSSPYAFKLTKKTIHASKGTIRLMKKADLTIGEVKAGIITLDQVMTGQIRPAIVNTKVMQKLIHTGRGIKTTANTAKKYFIMAGNGIYKTVSLSRGVMNGTIRIQISRQSIARLRKKTVQGIRIAGKAVWRPSKIVIKSGFVTMGTGLKTTYKGIKSGLRTVGDSFTNSNDFEGQAIGALIKTPHAVKSSAKAVRITYLGLKTGVTTTIKTGKLMGRAGIGIARGVKSVRTYGWRHTGKSFVSKSKRLLSKAGNSVVTLLTNSIKIIARKFMIPLLIIIVIAGGALSAASGSISAVLSVFGGFSINSDTGEDIDEIQWLTSKVTQSRNDLVAQIKDIRYKNLVENGGIYHLVRLYSTPNNIEINLTDTNILNAIHSTADYVEYIQPIFHTIMLSEYDLEASTASITDLYNGIWHQITRVTEEELPAEYCFGATQSHSCGSYHAEVGSCPNHTAGTHEAYTCSGCCYYIYKCGGHQGNLNCSQPEHSHTSACYNTTYHSDSASPIPNCGNSTKTEACNGYDICNGHKVLGLYINIKGFDVLLREYFLDQINEYEMLKAIRNLTEEEEMHLENLQDNYEICMAVVEIMSDEFGAADGTIIDINDVELTALTEYACSFIGNPYIWGGTSLTNGADCSGFVQQVYKHFNVDLPRTSREQVTVGVTIYSLEDAIPGDLIFWAGDWKGNSTDAEVNHVSIYIGNGKIVHARNSKPYPLGGIQVTLLSDIHGVFHKIKRIAN